ncbi:MAG: hypothetical protein ACYSTS_18310 [Planctomycetota bacterium]
MPCWYIIIGIVWSIFQGARGVVETRLNNKDKEWKSWEKYIVLYIHDFAFRFICTLSGFFALYVSYSLLANTANVFKLSSGASLLLVFSFLIGVIGVGGQLHYVILIGKLPYIK